MKEKKISISECTQEPSADATGVNVQLTGTKASTSECTQEPSADTTGVNVQSTAGNFWRQP
jgi:hypothetical protein